MIGLLVNEDVLDFIPPRHYAAYIFGIMPSIYDWVVNIAARTPIPDGASGAEYNTNLTGFSSWFGVLAFKRGSLLISMFWTAILVKTIDRKWTQVALWCTVAAVFSSLGVIHVPEAGVSQFTDSSWEQCDDVDECWQHAEQWTFMTAYLMMGATSLVVNAAKRCDSAIQDEIDDNSRPPFHDWFDNAAVPTEFVANVDRANVRSYLPSLRDIQRYQHSALQDEETMPTATATRSNHAEPP
jgi:AGZA family xanthine/uracil permease-like MFS transporter